MGNTYKYVELYNIELRFRLKLNFYDRNEISHNNLSGFVDEYVWRDILRLPLLGVAKMELYKDRVMCENLRKFVMKALEKWIDASIGGKDAKSDIKKLDAMTIELLIPTKYSITSRLAVRQLLLCSR